jgi:hypothetical protein
LRLDLFRRGLRGTGVNAPRCGRSCAPVNSALDGGKKHRRLSLSFDRTPKQPSCYVRQRRECFHRSHGERRRTRKKTCEEQRAVFFRRTLFFWRLITVFMLGAKNAPNIKSVIRRRKKFGGASPTIAAFQVPSFGRNSTAVLNSHTHTHTHTHTHI